jgi:outer membrane protein assembly factor BamE (lipoprotein component of BamABCDE complex)
MRLVEQILNSNVLIGMKKTEVSKNMGDPVFPESEKLWFYVFLTEDGEWFLKMDLDHDVVAGAYLEHQEIR